MANRLLLHSARGRHGPVCCAVYAMLGAWRSQVRRAFLSETSTMAQPHHQDGAARREAEEDWVRHVSEGNPIASFHANLLLSNHRRAASLGP